MKKIFWLISISCFLQAIAGKPSIATDVNSIADEKSAETAVNEFTFSQDNLDDSTSIFANDVFSSNQFLDIENKPQIEPLAVVKSNQLQQIESNCSLVGQATPLSTTVDLNNQLDELKSKQFPATIPGSSTLGVSPGLSINNPIGFGADNNVGFLSGSYQARTRFTQKSDGELGVGIGLGDAVNAVGLEISYTINSFGTSQGFGSGGFNAKLHKRIAEGTGVAVGWNRFANVQFGSNPTDYPQNSYYAVATQILRTSDNLDDVFSRLALSIGVGGGQFLSQDTLNKTPAGTSPDGVNVFGSAAVRIAKPVSAIVEWTGQDLSAGLSITPFGDGFPLVITPAFRDISGVTGESARFVLGVGTAFKF